MKNSKYKRENNSHVPIHFSSYQLRVVYTFIIICFTYFIIYVARKFR